MTQPPAHLAHGAVDLSRLAGPPPSAGAPAAGASATALVIDVTEAGFETDVVERSMAVPVVVDFWAEWCEPCKQLSPLLERLTAEYGGRFVLAKIDVDAEQRLAGAAGVQGIPMVIGVVGGQAVPLFTGALPEADVRRYLDELLKVAAANGVSGTAAPPDPNAGQPDASAAAAQEVVPPDPHAEAFELLRTGNLQGAADTYRALLETTPTDVEARTGLARVELIERISARNPDEIRADALARPDDVVAQTAAADLDIADGRIEAGLTRLVRLVGRVDGDERDQARAHLLALFDVAGPADPRVAAARTALANALF